MQREQFPNKKKNGGQEKSEEFFIKFTHHKPVAKEKNDQHEDIFTFLH